MKTKKHSYFFNYYLAILLALILIVPSFIFNNSEPTVAAINLSGSGTSSNPYKISSTSDLTTLANWVNSGNDCSGQYFELTNNISGSGVPVIGSLVYSDGVEYERKFKGIFNGNGFSISNVNRTNNTTNQRGDLGLFGYLQGTVRNLIILNGTITLSATGKSAGAIAGSTYSGSLIERCFNSGCTIRITTSTLVNAQLGGLVGAGGGDTTIRYSGNSASVTSRAKNVAYSGGIIGMQNVGGASISQCYNTGNITAGTTSTAESYAGGIIGKNGSISNCYNTGDITANAKQITDESTTENSIIDYSDIKISSKTSKTTKNTPAYAGGISGSTTYNVSNCYNTGLISGGKSIVTIDNIVYTYLLINVTSNSFNATEVHEDKDVTTQISYDEKVYYSDINGNVSKSSIGCYGINTNISNNFNYNIYEYGESVTTFYNRLGGSNSEKEVFLDNVLANKTNSNYVSISIKTTDRDGWYANIKNSYLNITFSSGVISIILSADLEFIQGKDSTTVRKESFSCYSGPCVRNQNYTIRSLTYMKTSSFTNTLGSTYWTYNSLINNGLPYLKSTMWPNNSKPFN